MIASYQADLFLKKSSCLRKILSMKKYQFYQNIHTIHILIDFLFHEKNGIILSTMLSDTLLKKNGYKNFYYNDIFQKF